MRTAAVEKATLGKRLLGKSIAALIFILPALFLPQLLCGKDAGAAFRGDAGFQNALAREVASWVARGVSEKDFSTGSDLFDGEWVYGTYMMAGLGLAQVVREHPETAGKYVPVIETCIDRLLDPATRKFDTDSWGEDAIDSLAGDKGHAAYLGYMNLLLGAYRQVAREPRYNLIHDQITAALARRASAGRTKLIETYPDETYPVDNCAVAGSIGLYDAVTGADHSVLLAEWAAACRTNCIDARSGLLFQAVWSDSGEPADRPRASGTALGAYFLSFCDRNLSRRLHSALKNSCGLRIGGFGFMKEYPPTVKAGRGDIDSGPVVLGLSFSGTGFALATSRIHGDRDLFDGLYRTAHLVGSPLRSGGRSTYVCGGPLGNAIMLAMLTAR